MSSILDQDIMFLPGVGPKKKEILSKELGINSYGDLLEYYPYKYVDRSRIFHISELTPDMPYVQIKGRILSYEEFDTGKRNKRLVAHFSDGFGVGRFSLVPQFPVHSQVLSCRYRIHRLRQTSPLWRPLSVCPSRHG